MPKTQIQSSKATKFKVKEPSMYNVIMQEILFGKLTKGGAVTVTMKNNNLVITK